MDGDQIVKNKDLTPDYPTNGQDAEGGYTGTRAICEAMNIAKTTTDVEKLIKTLEELKMDYNKGPEQFRACDHIRMTSCVIVRGIGAKAT
jgi:hypothetical protein